jgi:hypothetical protein
MGIRTYVREHARRNAPKVRDYVRGAGSRAAKFSGEYGGKAASRLRGASDSAKLGIKAKIAAAIQAQKAIVEQRRLDKQEEKDLRDAIYREEKVKVDEEKAAAKIRKIRAEARLKARQGGTISRGLKLLLSEAKKEAKRK